ncbi:hypothetical protein PBY51_006878 [Eleginops maclovinus]|uniref:Uncharacterized protein n=1 Tax=Eleginops maclovinus TaxID=56733 RepID=A0AAN7X1Z9_ELEMC|nr:hypothetical protein PBY51_006878 [Eleginops maclovinus]
MDSEDEFPYAVVYDDEEFTISSQQEGHDALEMIASVGAQGHYSSVRPFQSARYENEDATTRDPPASLQEEEEEKEEEEGGGGGGGISRKKLPIQCVDNVDGFPRVIIYGDETFPFSHQQDTAQQPFPGDGPYSSVQPFQSDHYENGDADVSIAGLDNVQSLEEIVVQVPQVAPHGMVYGV